MLDTAGRLHIDEELMAEAAAVRDIAKPHETLLVADALTGQDAVNLARASIEKVGISAASCSPASMAMAAAVRRWRCAR